MKKSLTSHLRSVAKSLSWRTVSVIEGLIVAYLLTGDLKCAASLIGTTAVTSTILYYFHERAWNLAQAKA